MKFLAALATLHFHANGNNLAALAEMADSDRVTVRKLELFALFGGHRAGFDTPEMAEMAKNLGR